MQRCLQEAEEIKAKLEAEETIVGVRKVGQMVVHLDLLLTQRLSAKTICVKVINATLQIQS